MATLALVCAVAPDNVPVDPCGTLGGVAYHPIVDLTPAPPLDSGELSGIFAAFFGPIVGVFVLGHVIGKLVRLTSA